MLERTKLIRLQLLLACLAIMIALPILIYFYSTWRASEYTRQLIQEKVGKRYKAALDFSVKLKAALEASKYDFRVPVLLFAGKGWGKLAEVKTSVEKLTQEAGYSAITLTDASGRVLIETIRQPEAEPTTFLKIPLAEPQFGEVELTRRYQSYRFTIPMAFGGSTAWLKVEVPEEGMSFELSLLESKAKVAAWQISLVCAALLSLAAAYIFYLHDRTVRLHAQLEKERRLGYLGRMSAALAHEIRNPLSSIRLTSQLLLARTSDEELKPKLKRISDEVARLEDALSNFLAFSRPDAPLPRKLDFRTFLEESLDLLRPLCTEHGISLELALDGDIGTASLDPNSFGRAIRNIVLNSIEALQRTGGSIRVRAWRSGSTLQIEISDTGPGIPEPIRKSIFEEFFTTKDSGTGLGLTIARRIVEDHNGDLTLCNGTGGACFRITLRGQ